MKVSKTGYKRNSKDRNEPALRIPSSSITMRGVDHPVVGVDNNGNVKLMFPGEDYEFSGDYVNEYPLKQDGGETNKQREWLRAYVNSPKYLERLQSEGFTDPKKEQVARLKNLDNAKVIYKKSIGKRPGVISGEHVNGNVYLENEYQHGSGFPGFETIPVHEFGHVLDEGGKRIPATTVKNIHSNTVANRPDRTVGGLEFGYYNSPTEFVNRLQPIRYLLNQEKIYDAKTQTFDKSHYDKMFKSDKIKNNSHFKDIFDSLKGSDEDKKQQFIYMMNNIAMDNSKYSPNGYARYGGRTFQLGGTPKKLTPQQWYDQNVAAGYKPASQYGEGTNTQELLSVGKYPSFYNPNEYSPTDTGYVNLKNPGLKYGDANYNPFIEYKAPETFKAPKKGLVIPNSGRKAINFSENSTTYQYDDGRVITYDSQGNEIKPMKYGGIHLDPAKKGTFTAAASKHKMGVQEFASHVLANKEKFTPKMVKKANFARNFAKQFGGDVKFKIPYTTGKNLQGVSSDGYRKQLNADFINYLSGNLKTNMYRNDINMFQDGGEFAIDDPFFLQSMGIDTSDMSGGGDGQQISAPQHPLGSPSQPGYYNGPFGAWGNQGLKQPPPQSPGLNSTAMKQFVPVQGNAGMSFGNVLRPGASTSSPPMQQGIVGMDGNVASQIPSAILNLINMAGSQADSFRQEQKLKQQQTIENSAPTSYGSRGDYDPNQGFFRPDQMTSKVYRMGGTKNCYKAGGSYDVDHDELLSLIKQGYKIQFT